MVIPLTYGRMGNFLFQAAATIGYALRHNLEFTLPNRTKNPVHNPIYLQHLVNNKWDPTLPRVTVEEQKFHYVPIPFQEEWRNGYNIVLDGYWQSEKYFKEFRTDILDLFEFPWESRIGHVSVHVRRGDYLRLTQKHPAVPKSWIEAAMKELPGYTYVFFSDDMEWCKKEFGNRKDCKFFHGNSCEDDLVEMSCCEHHICSASTFSWWGAWLNRSNYKKVLLPKLWFVPGHGGHDTRDVVPSEWIRF